jgi:hypothetical protein
MPRTCANLLFCTFAVSMVAGQYFDMSEGDPGMDTPCPSGNLHEGVWTEEDASSYPDPPEGPLDGKVLTSQFQTRSCIRTPELFVVDQDYQFQMQVYLPKAEIEPNKKKLLVWLVEENDGSYLITDLKGPSEANWHLIQIDVPRSPGIIYPSNFKVNQCDCLLDKLNAPIIRKTVFVSSFFLLCDQILVKMRIDHVTSPQFVRGARA